MFASAACIAIVKGYKAKRPALEVPINRALSPEAQGAIAREYWHSPTNRKVTVPRELQHVVLPAEGSPVKIVPVDLEQFYQARSMWLDRLNKVFLQ